MESCSQDKKRSAEEMDLIDTSASAAARRRLDGSTDTGHGDEVAEDEAVPEERPTSPVRSDADVDRRWLEPATVALYGGDQFMEQRSLYASMILIKGVCSQLQLPPLTEARALDLLADVTRVAIDWQRLPNASVVLAILFDACHMHGPITSFQQLAAAASVWNPEAASVWNPEVIVVGADTTIGRAHILMTQVLVRQYHEQTASELVTTLCAALAWPTRLRAAIVQVAHFATALGVAGDVKEHVAAACASVAIVNEFEGVTVASIIAAAASVHLRISLRRAAIATAQIEARGGLLFHCRVPAVWYSMPYGGNEQQPE